MDKLNTIRYIYADVKVFMLDEVSMIGRKTWNALNERLQNLKGNNQPFGGLHVIAFGDFFQLPPIGDNFLFQEPFEGEISQLAENPWSQFHIMELTQIMRQKDDLEFAKIGSVREIKLPMTSSNNTLEISPKTFKTTKS